MLQSALNLLIALAALIAILDWFGIKPSPQSWGAIMPRSRLWKLAIMLGLVAASLGLSGYSFYRAIRPKIVEKVVEKPVQKIVPQECPKTDSSKQQSTHDIKKDKPAPHTSTAPSQTATGNNNAQVGSGITTGDCSAVQVGGSNNQATTNCNPQRHLSEAQKKALSDVAGSLPLGLDLSVYAINESEPSGFGKGNIRRTQT